MPTDYDETYANGVLVARVPREVFNDELHRRNAMQRVRAMRARLQAWRTEADTVGGGNGTVPPGQQRQLFARFAALCDDLDYLLLALGVDSD